MKNIMFNVLDSDNCVIHSFSEEINANKYIELRKSIDNEYLDIEQEEIKEDLDLKIVEVVTITANLQLNQDVKIFISTEEKVNIDVNETIKSMPIFLFGIYEYKMFKIIPSCIKEKEKYIESLKEQVKNDIIRNYNDYATMNNLKNVFTLKQHEINFLNQFSKLHHEICALNNKFIDEYDNEDLLFELFVTESMLENISILEKLIQDKYILNKYEEYKKIIIEYNEFKSKYKFVLKS